MDRCTRQLPGKWSVRIPYWLYDAGCFKGRAMGSVFQVFACLVRYADWTTGNGRLGRAKIAAVTGLQDSKTLARAFTVLRQMGLVKVWWRMTDRGCIRYYQLARSAEQMRENTLTYLTLSARKASCRYVRGISSPGGREKSPHQCSSVSCTSVRTPSSQCSTTTPPEHPLRTTLVNLMTKIAITPPPVSQPKAGPVWAGIANGNPLTGGGVTQHGGPVHAS